MKLSFLSAPHLLMIVAALWFVGGTFLILRGRTVKVKRAALLTLAFLNLAQHIFKGFLWPHMYGTGFSDANTAYNLCALLIYLTPVVLFFRTGILQDTVMYIGTIGPALTLLVPTWFQGQDFLQWEVLRFFVCHVLLIATSLLPLLLGLHTPRASRAPFLPFVFFGMLGVILLNDAVCCFTGLMPSDDVFGILYALNPCWAMHPAPAPGLEWLGIFLERCSPSFLRSYGPLPYLPILWYATPMYVILSFFAFLFSTLIERHTERMKAHDLSPASALPLSH